MTEYAERYKQSVQDFFDGRSTYDNPTTIRRVQPLLNRLRLDEGDRVLDIATGTGLIAIEASHRVGPTGQIVGVDLSSTMLKQAQQKIDRLGLSNVTLIEADVDSQEFTDSLKPAQFDVVVCSSALVYFSDILGCLRQWHRWLVPNGTVLFSVGSDTSYLTPLIIDVAAQQGIHLRNINEFTGKPSACKKLLAQAGFTDIVIERHQRSDYVPVEQVQSWNGTFFHPHENGLLDLSPDAHQRLVAAVTHEVRNRSANGQYWMEIVEYVVSGRQSTT